MMKNDIITLHKAVARNPLVRLEHPVNFRLSTNKHIAIVGPNGAGKSLLVDTLMGKYPLVKGELTFNFPSEHPVHECIKYISFRDTYGAADANYYYQQRWNSTDQEDIPTVREKLGDALHTDMAGMLLRLFDMEPLLDKKIILLSSGELRKFQLIRALLATPYVLIIDNPFIGLDADAREMLNELLKQISELANLQIILILSQIYKIPKFITDIIPMSHKTVGEPIPHEEYYPNLLFRPDPDESNTLDKLSVFELPLHSSQYNSQEIIRLTGVSIRYGDRTILKELNWVVKRGEKWALSGANGSGKSTLLSLICADNPQSYACNIELFGKKRGTGESIWDIKSHIGYVSPEMHRAYLKNIPTIEIVASGLHDSIGLYKRPRPEQLEVCAWWMNIFGIGALKDKPFLQLSSGEQRLTLLARAFVKDPELLILDEPLHGLDTFNRKRVKQIIEAFCQRKNKTLIMVTHYQEELPECITNHLKLTKQN